MKSIQKTQVLLLLSLLLISCSSQLDEKPAVSTYDATVRTTLKTGEEVSASVRAYIEVRGKLDKLQFQKTCKKITASVLQEISLRQISRGYRGTAAALIAGGLEEEYSRDIVVKALNIVELLYPREIEEKFRAMNWTINQIQKQNYLISKYKNELNMRKYEFQQTGDHTKKTRIEALEKLITDTADRVNTLKAELASIKKDLFQIE